MSKYSVEFCDCGTVHFLENETINNICMKNGRLTGREVLHVCLQWGNAFIRGLDEYDENGYITYKRNVDKTIAEVKESEYYTILSKGTRIMMESGRYADSYRGGLYIDECGLKEAIGSSNIDEIEGVAHWRDNPKYKVKEIKAINVSMGHLLKSITKEQAESMCGFRIKSFDWSGTSWG